MSWWSDAVVYQVYPRSFQDSDGDGVGDLAGIEARLDHVAALGASAIWLSPIYPSPLADFGYDVSDHEAVDPVYGTLEDFDRLVAAAHRLGLRLLMDLVPCHTSIEHAWFRDHPDWYVWADGRGERPPNNWLATFGGSAWSRRGDRWYLHSFYPEQPDLDWRNPELVRAMQGVIRFWLDRGVDGFRIDAIDRLVKDAELRDDPPASEPFGLPLRDEESRLALSNSRNAPDTGHALARIREAAGDAWLVGEIYLPSERLEPYLEHLDSAFAFELFHTRWEATELRRLLNAAPERSAWVVSNHDFRRMPARFGRENVRAAAMLLLTLPGPAFVYQGDEIGMGDGPGHDPPFDRAGRDRHRHPMQWDGSPSGGFTGGKPWLPPIDPARRNVARQGDDTGSLLTLYRELIRLRRELDGDLELIDATPGVLAYRRGRHAVALNLTSESRPAPRLGETVLESGRGALHRGALAAHAGAITVD